MVVQKSLITLLQLAKFGYGLSYLISSSHTTGIDTSGIASFC